MGESVVGELREIVGDKYVLAEPEELYVYSFDASGLPPVKPLAVVLPATTEEVSAVLKLANEKRIPVVPRGGGTGLTGAGIPVEDSIVLDLSRMNKILEINVTSGYVFAEAGVRLDELNAELAKYGYFLPPDPASSSVCTLGGSLAECAGGMRGLKYGTFREWVLALEVVLATGDVLWLGEKVTKCREGYDLVHLFVGSEGTLGIITKAALKIWPLPEKIVRILALFDTAEDAGRAVAEIRGAGLVPLVMEFLDSEVIKLVNKFAGQIIPEVGAALIIDVDGEAEVVWKHVREIEDILKKCGAVEVKCSDDPKEMERLYLARRAAYPACLRLRPMPAVLIEDIVVPPEKLPEAVRRIKEIGRKYGRQILTFGHIGDGNIHPIAYTDPADPEHWKKTLECLDEINMMAVELGGAVSGEHGIGILKKEALRMWLERRKSSKALEIMRKIKEVLDPNNILNPGKVI